MDRLTGAFRHNGLTFAVGNAVEQIVNSVWILDVETHRTDVWIRVSFHHRLNCLNQEAIDPLLPRIYNFQDVILVERCKTFVEPQE
jgi:hypothetical protein